MADMTNQFLAVARAQAVDMPTEASSDSKALAKYLRCNGVQPCRVTVGGLELELEPLSPSIGTLVHGVDLAKLDAELVAFLRSVWLQRKVLFFRGQSHLSRQQHLELAEHFGVVGATHGERDWVPDNEQVSTDKSSPKGYPDIIYIYSDEKSRSSAAAWHSDVMWSSRPPMGSMLLARNVPAVGGDTCFCDMYAMWESLPKGTQKQLEGLSALNVGAAGHMRDGKVPSAKHPCARTHPETGRTGLYVSPAFTRKILGVPDKEAQALLTQCYFQAGRPEFCCRFSWQPGSLAFWDNRACMHYATPDYWPHTRHLERVTVLDRDEARKMPYFAGGGAKL